MNKLTEYGIIAVAALLLLGGLYLKGRNDGVESEQDKQAIAIAKAIQNTRDEESRKRSMRDTQETGYLNRIRDLESLVRAPVRREPIRLCIPARSDQGGTNTAPISPDAADTSREPVLQAGPDIAAELVSYGEQCERFRLTVAAWQEWELSNATVK